MAARRRRRTSGPALIWVAVAMALGFAAGRQSVLSGPASGRTPGAPTTRGASPGAGAPTQTGSPVVRVVDGDTVVVRYRAPQPPEGTDEHVRLLNVDTPERGRPWHREATAELERLLSAARAREGRGDDDPATSVELIFEEPGTAAPMRDRYGRILAYLVMDGVNVNVEMVRRGWSAYETGYGTGRFEAEFRAAEREARRARRGMWSGG